MLFRSGFLDAPVEAEGEIAVRFFGPEVFVAGGFGAGVVVDHAANPGTPSSTASAAAALSPAQIMKIASSNTLLCRMRVDDDLVWTLLTNHARVLLLIARDPDARLRDLADAHRAMGEGRIVDRPPLFVNLPSALDPTMRRL